MHTGISSEAKYLVYLISQVKNSATLLIIAKDEEPLAPKLENKNRNFLTYKVQDYSFTGLWINLHHTYNLYLQLFIAKLNKPDSSELPLDLIERNLHPVPGEEHLFEIEKFQINFNGFKANNMDPSNKNDKSKSTFYSLNSQENEEERGSNVKSSRLNLSRLNAGDKEFKNDLGLSNGNMYKTTLTDLIDIQADDKRIKVELELGMHLTDGKTKLAEVELEGNMRQKLGIKVSRLGNGNNVIRLLGCFPRNNFFAKLIKKKEKNKGKEGSSFDTKIKQDIKGKLMKIPFFRINKRKLSSGKH